LEHLKIVAELATGFGTLGLALITLFLLFSERSGLVVQRKELKHLADSLSIERESLAKAEEALTTQRNQQAATAIFDILGDEYLDRSFKSRGDIRIDNKTVSSVREAKRLARRKYETRWADWDAASDIDRDEWENHLAFELGVALERLGIAVFTGVVPVQVFLALAADQVLEDWILCRGWIRSYQKKHRVTDATGMVTFHRRHAEWLVLLSALWMKKHFPMYQPLSNVLEEYQGQIQRVFASHTIVEIELMPLQVVRSISQVTAVPLQKPQAAT
jgi:hypothetical protein